MKLLPKLALIATGVAAVSGVGAIWGAPTAAMDASLAQAGTVRASALDDVREVEHLRATARHDKDIIKLSCVNDKMVQIKPEMNLIDHAYQRVQLASDGGEQHTALQAMADSADRVHKLRGNAEECAGSRVLSSETANAFTHPDITENPTDNQYETTVEPPIYASPFN